MPTGKIKMFDEGRGFGFIKADDGGVDVFFHISALREGDKITQGKAVKFEIGVDHLLHLVVYDMLKGQSSILRRIHPDTRFKPRVTFQMFF